MVAVFDVDAYVVNVQQTLSTDDIPRSMGRAFDLLEIVLGMDGCNLTMAAEKAGLTPTTTLRYLRALEGRGYLLRDDAGLFAAGPTMLRLAAAVRDDGPLDRLIRMAQSHLDSLAGDTGESCYLAIADGDAATYVATAESARPIRHVGWVGQTVSLDGSAVGAALAVPRRVITRTGTVEPDITAISLALPPYGPVRAAISVIGPAHRIVGAPEQRIQSLLEASVASLCADLGLSTQHENRNAS